MERAEVTLAPEIRARLDRARGTLIFLRWVVPIVQLGVVAFVSLQNGLWQGIFVPAALAVICFVYYGRRQYRPWSWPVSAKLVGGLAGFETFTSAGALFVKYVPLTSVAQFLVIVVFGGVLIGGAGCWWVAKRGRDRVLTPYAADLIDSPIEIGFPSTGDRHVTLLVRADEIELVGSYWQRYRNFHATQPLASVGGVEPIDVRETRSQGVSGTDNKVMTVHSGPAVRIALRGNGVWVLNTDRGADIVELIEGRRGERAGFLT